LFENFNVNSSTSDQQFFGTLQNDSNSDLDPTSLLIKLTGTLVSADNLLAAAQLVTAYSGFDGFSSTFKQLASDLNKQAPFELKVFLFLVSALAFVWLLIAFFSCFLFSDELKKHWSSSFSSSDNKNNKKDN